MLARWHDDNKSPLGMMIIVMIARLLGNHDNISPFSLIMIIPCRRLDNYNSSPVSAMIIYCPLARWLLFALRGNACDSSVGTCLWFAHWRNDYYMPANTIMILWAPDRDIKMVVPQWVQRFRGHNAWIVEQWVEKWGLIVLKSSEMSVQSTIAWWCWQCTLVHMMLNGRA